MSISTFTTLHVAISLVAIATGLVVLVAMVRGHGAGGHGAGGMTAVFLLTTVATSATGFLFPISVFTPALLFGIISLAALALALFALYGRHLVGAWRPVYVVSAVFALYLNAFVGIVQSFQKLPFLQDAAPTQSEPPFLAAQAVLLVLFVVAGVLAVRRFHRH